jgi:hypothetical protein
MKSGLLPKILWIFECSLNIKMHSFVDSQPLGKLARSNIWWYYVTCLVTCKRLSQAKVYVQGRIRVPRMSARLASVKASGTKPHLPLFYAI